LEEASWYIVWSDAEEKYLNPNGVINFNVLR